MEKILVTGGAGFIGSNFIRYMLKKYPHYKIINLDKLTYAGNLDNLKDIEKNRNYKFIRGDICDKKKVAEVMKHVDYVVHFAAETHVDRSILYSKDFIKTNVYGTYILLEAARSCKKLKKFIHISTDEVYGSIERGRWKENAPLHPSSPYAASKASADMLALSYFKTYNLPVIITRSCNNYGPYQYPEKLIPLFITNILENKHLPLYGKGENVRSWIFVEDNCAAIDLVLHRGASGEIYNISVGEERKNIEVAMLLLCLMGKPLTWIKYVKDRPGHDYRYAVDNGKIKELGFRRKTPFTEGLKYTIEWYKNNTIWWKKIKHRSLFEKYYDQWYSKERA
jgi:dTDP-glucose 4,6-dehydratase